MLKIISYFFNCKKKEEETPTLKPTGILTPHNTPVEKIEDMPDEPTYLRLGRTAVDCNDPEWKETVVHIVQVERGTFVKQFKE